MILFLFLATLVTALYLIVGAVTIMYLDRNYKEQMNMVVGPSLLGIGFSLPFWPITAVAVLYLHWSDTNIQFIEPSEDGKQ